LSRSFFGKSKSKGLDNEISATWHRLTGALHFVSRSRVLGSRIQRFRVGRFRGSRVQRFRDKM